MSYLLILSRFQEHIYFRTPLRDLELQIMIHFLQSTIYPLLVCDLKGPKNAIFLRKEFSRFMPTQ